jgi:hypothetical protein
VRSTSAALPSRPIDSARPSLRAASSRASASSSDPARSSRYAVSIRRSMRCRSTSTQSAQPSFIVTASGCAPPIPPSPAVTTSLPRSEPPNRCRASAANVSYVPCRIPWVPM